MIAANESDASSSSAAATGGGAAVAETAAENEQEDEEWEQVGRRNKTAIVRKAVIADTSPIVSIFGGTLRK